MVNSNFATYFVLAGLGVLAAIALWHSATTSGVAVWRRVLLMMGAVSNAVSTLAFLWLNIRDEAIPRYMFFLWISFGLAAVLAGTFGRRSSRLLVVANGITLVVCWYLLGLGNTP